MKNFFGNREAVATLEQMAASGRIHQTLMLVGPEGVGKATLARRFAASLIGGEDKIERDDLSLPANLQSIAERDKLTSDKRADDPLLFGSHPDFLTFPPDGPLRQITIQQMRLLKERAAFKPTKGRWRVFLIDRIDRANDQAANSLLKTLEEPPEHLILILTAGNAYDLLPTIRSRVLPIHLSPLAPEEMEQFVLSRGLSQPERRIQLASGCPGVAVDLDLEIYDKRRSAMLALLEAASGRSPFAKWMKHAESISASRTEKLDNYLRVLYILIEDILLLQQGAGEIRNADIRPQLHSIASHVSFEWVRKAVQRVDELGEMVRRNIQKGIALDALVLALREP